MQSVDDPSTFFLGYSSDPWGTSSKLLESQGQFLEDTDVGQAAKRSKRGVLHLYNMVLCATGCDPLAFKGYGCYCGFLGSGYTVDGIDRWEEHVDCRPWYSDVSSEQHYLSLSVANRLLSSPVHIVFRISSFIFWPGDRYCDWLVRGCIQQLHVNGGITPTNAAMLLSLQRATNEIRN